jgi:hypothetical protein
MGNTMFLPNTNGSVVAFSVVLNALCVAYAAEDKMDPMDLSRQILYHLLQQFLTHH